MQFLVSHWSVLLPSVLLFVKSALDLYFVFKPESDAPGGVLDWIYQQVKK